MYLHLQSSTSTTLCTIAKRKNDNGEKEVVVGCSLLYFVFSQTIKRGSSETSHRLSLRAFRPISRQGNPLANQRISPHDDQHLSHLSSHRCTHHRSHRHDQRRSHRISLHDDQQLSHHRTHHCTHHRSHRHDQRHSQPNSLRLDQLPSQLSSRQLSHLRPRLLNPPRNQLIILPGSQPAALPVFQLVSPHPSLSINHLQPQQISQVASHRFIQVPSQLPIQLCIQASNPLRSLQLNHYLVQPPAPRCNHLPVPQLSQPIPLQHRQGSHLVNLHLFLQHNLLFPPLCIHQVNRRLHLQQFRRNNRRAPQRLYPRVSQPVVPQIGQVRAHLVYQQHNQHQHHHNNPSQHLRQSHLPNQLLHPLVFLPPSRRADHLVNRLVAQVRCQHRNRRCIPLGSHQANQVAPQLVNRLHNPPTLRVSPPVNQPIQQANPLPNPPRSRLGSRPVNRQRGRQVFPRQFHRAVSVQKEMSPTVILVRKATTWQILTGTNVSLVQREVMRRGSITLSVRLVRIHTAPVEMVKAVALPSSSTWSHTPRAFST